MPKRKPRVIYWDASAVLSALFKDSHSDDAMKWTRGEDVHLLTSLGYAETCAVIARLQRERILADALVEAAHEALADGPWRRLNALPDWNTMVGLSKKWPLRGADLWHLATAKTLKTELPELILLTFDLHLRKAARGEDLFR
jgi:predicted nucleic acid-binding protein